MKNFIKMTGKLMAITQILAVTLLAACSAVNVSANVCHATDDAANPYEEITIDSAELVNEHRGHSNDIFPVPVGGCPASQVLIVDGMVTICHATNSETNPYEEITISVNGLNGHGGHEGDIIPVPEEGCPTTPIVADNDETTICHATDDAVNPYEEITVTSAELNEHLGHPNDINPALSSGCPSYPLVVENGEIAFCHANGSETDPFDEITVSVNGLDGHDEHTDDVFPVSEEQGCPVAPLVTDNDKITICHATNSKKNPYNEITISVSGLNGHNKHEGDIIPAPAGGCPVTK